MIPTTFNEGTEFLRDHGLHEDDVIAEHIIATTFN
jgi:hypothetical protein